MDSKNFAKEEILNLNVFIKLNILLVEGQIIEVLKLIIFIKKEKKEM